MNAHTDTDEHGNPTGGAEQYGEPYAAPHGAESAHGAGADAGYAPYTQEAAYGQHVPRSWGGGEYDADATAFVQLPSGGFGEFAEDVPLAAPGTGQGGYTPPPIDPSSHTAAEPGSGSGALPPAAGTDPAAGGHWVLPFAPENGEQGSGGPGQPGQYGQPGPYGRAGQYGAGPEAGPGGGSPEHGPAGAPDPHDTLGGQSGHDAPGAATGPAGAAPPAGLGQGAAAALAGSHEARTGRRPLGTGVARAATADEEPAQPAPGSPATGTPASGTPVPGTPATGTPVPGTPASGTPVPGSSQPGPGAPGTETAHAWAPSAPSSPTSAPSWDSTAPAPGSASEAVGPGPLPPQEPGTDAWPTEEAPGSAPAAAYSFPDAPTTERTDAAPAEQQQPLPAEPQPAAGAGIVASEPPAPPAGPESNADSEVTSLAEAAPAPAPVPQQAAPQQPEPEPTPATQPDAAPRTGQAGDADAPDPAGGAGTGAGEADTAAGAEGADAGAEPGTDDGADPEPEGSSEEPSAEPSQHSGTGPAEDGDGDTAPLPEAVDTEDEHPHVSYVLRVNGVDRPVASAWIGESLLYVLRERLGLAGAKDGCSQGECGACSVQVDGRLVAACLVPAATAAGSEVRTVEGLSADGTPSDVQCALAESGSVQCGFCVPGLAMTVHDLLEGNHAPTELETRKAISGNLCRCSGYRGVLDAVRTVVEQRAAQAEREAAEAEAQVATGRQPDGPGGPGTGQQPGPAGHGQGGYDPQGGYGHGVPEQQPGGYQQPAPYEQYGQGGYDQGGYDQGGYPTGGYGAPQGGGYDYDPAAHGHHGTYDGGAYDNGAYDGGTYDDGTYGAHIPHQTRHPDNGGES
ncbi:2Fe-2S iron-sulfur cluster-binding protein [Streptomyces smyrnaeus]|uniref:2Fe-2S iron-sulfur cluster-binding protein n=2 Tax=Streptomyces smyrnaeus TaxID=1387713 RepID=UPI0036AA21FC